MKKIFIGGCPFGSENIGDDAIIGSIVTSFSNDNHQITISTIKSNDKIYLAKYLERKNKKLDFHTNGIYSKSLFGIYLNSMLNPIQTYCMNRKNQKSLQGTDLFLCGGGTLITDMPVHLIKMLMQARKLAIPTVVFGVGMAEIKYKSQTPALVKELNYLKDIYVRDEFVKIKLEKIGVAAEKIKISYDPALMLEPNPNCNLGQYLSADQIEKYNNGKINIGITLSSERDVKDRTAIDKVKMLIDYLIKTYHANIFLIPTNYRKNADYQFMLPLCKNNIVSIIKTSFIPEDFIQFMQNFQLVISSRLHMNILCSITGTPFIGLIRNSKIIDYSTIHGLNTYALDDVNEPGFYNYVNQLIKENDTVRNKIICKVVQLKECHQKSVAAIIQHYL